MLRKLRVVVVVGAALLVTVVAGFVWYGRMVARRFRLDLPKRLGVNISQESHVVTLSRSVKGKTIFTVHAADQVQRKNGLIELHDVGIELFGREDGRSDKISGQDFLFDQKNGVMTGLGDVLIDLAEPTDKAGGARADKGEEKTVHVKTRGLVFNQAEQTAKTDQRIEFAANGLAGTAVGAEFDAKTGVMDLKSAVRVSGIEGESPVVLTASWAELQRVQNLILLRGAKYTAVGPQGARSIAAERAEVRITRDGTPQEVDAQGGVVLTAADRGTMTGENMELNLSDVSKPKAGRIWGAVHYGYDGPAKKMGGTAAEVQMAFDGAGAPSRAVALGGVNFRERSGQQTRTVSAARVDLEMAEALKGKTHLRTAKAAGGATIAMTGFSRGERATEVSGDELTARFTQVAGRDQISTLDGTGHTVVHQVASAVEQSSRGDVLAVRFRQGERSTGEPAGRIESATQRGGVKIDRVMRDSTKGPGVPVTVQHAAGNEAQYDAGSDRLSISGESQLQDETGVLQADRVEIAQSTGDATAAGHVRVTYAQASGGDNQAEQLHVTADRAVERKAAGTAEFFGGGGKDARMWQGESQVQAPVLSFSQSGKGPGNRRLVAHGEGSSGAQGLVVHAVLSSGATEAGKAPGKGDTSRGPVRISGQTMTYVESARTVEFTGGVRLQEADAAMTAKKAVAYLADRSKADTAGDLMGGRVERVVASGAVEVQEPGRRGTGEQLVYTAADRLFLLTGTEALPALVVDEARGTTAGTALRFRQGEDSVLISNDGSKDGLVRSEMRMRPKR